MLLITIIISLYKRWEMNFTRLRIIKTGLSKVYNYISAKKVCAKHGGRKSTAFIEGIQRALCANPLKADHNERSDRMHIAVYKRELMAFFKEIGFKCDVSVRGKNLDNVRTRLTFASNSMSAKTLNGVLNDAFYSPWDNVDIRVEEA